MILVLDIGAATVKYALSDEHGNFSDKGSFPTVKDDLSAFIASINHVLPPDCSGIAVSCPGIIDAEKGLIQAVTLIPCLQGVNLVDILQERFAVPVSIENDAKCALYAEMWQGSLQGVNSALMMVLGSGIGGALVLDGQVYKGSRFKAGEIGSWLCHDNISLGGKCSAVKLVRDLADMLHVPEDGKTVFAMLDNSAAYERFAEYCYMLAKAIYNADYLLDLDVVAIGGGISQAEIVIRTIQKCFLELRDQYEEDEHRPVIKACKFFNDANLLGALRHHLLTVPLKS